MRTPELAVAFALAFGLALAGCTKTPPPEDVTPASATPDATQGAPAASPSPSPSPSAATPPPTPTRAPPTPTPTPSTPPAPASTPPDLFVNKSGWAAPNAQTDPSTTVRLAFAVEASVKNVTLRATDLIVTPGGNVHGAPFTLTITDPRGRAVGPNATPVVDGAPVLPDAPSSADPQVRVLELNASAWLPGEYTVTMTLQAGVQGDQATAGERYLVSAYVHY